ncbi:MAG: glycosyltransferase [Anaerolineae bacterium]|nr:glycosyltransferase [Anaerolineae bacterium]
MLRVTHVIKVTNIAGAETHLLTLLAGLRARQIDAQLIMLVEPGKPMDAYVEALNRRDVPVQRLVIRGDLDPTLPPRMRGLLRLMKPHIVHTHLFHADLYGLLTAGWACPNAALVTSRHNDNAFRRREPYRRLNRWLWRVADAGIAISGSIARFAVEVEGAPAPKIETIPYGLDYVPQQPAQRQAARQAMRQSLGLSDETPVAGIVCRLVEQKGVPYGLQAFARVLEALPDARLLIAGDGPLRADLEAQAEALGLGDRVQFLGWREDVPQLMTAFDLLLLPSLWEGFGLVILEAMACQIPVVASAVSAIPEIMVDGETGLLAAPGDVDGLSRALVILLGDMPLRRHMGMLAEDRLETHFSARRMVDSTVKLYQRLI